MKKIISIFSIVVTAAFVFTSCTKVESLPYYTKGNPVTLSVSKNTIVPTIADSAKSVVGFSWTSPKYATDSTNYKFILEVDSTGKNFANEATKTVTGTLGTSLTGRELNSILLNKGYAVGTPVTLDVRVLSSYSNNNERYPSNVVKITATPYSDPATLITEKTSVTGTLPTASQPSNTFSWGPAFPGYSGDVTYVLEYDSSGKNFASPHNLSLGTSVYSKSLTVSEMNNTALDEGVAGGTAGKIEYRIKATTAQGAVAYSNVVSVTIQTYVPMYHMYVVGSMQGWDINNPWEIISDRADSRWGKVFYSYVKFNAGDEFLFVQTKGDWNSKYGATGGSGTTFDIGAPGNGNNFVIPATGIYRVTIDLNANKAYIQQKQVGVVGNMQGWDPSNPIYGSLLQKDQFLILATSNGSDGFKFHDGPAWDNSAPDKARWWGQGDAPGLLDKDGNGANLIANGTPMTRAIWDGTDPQQLKYSLSKAQLRVVGADASIGSWDPNNALNMTYIGNGKWQATFTLSSASEFKFVSEEGWSFNYGGSGGSANSGTISQNGANLNEPAGTYTVTVDEYNQTYTIM